ncbi:MAG: glycosyltransferase [Victivallales bacterium]|nr:glycosyltransferase [Victivallales bacterium]
MKIIQLITELHPAGAEKVVLNLSCELKKRGHNVSVVSLQPLPTENTDIVDSLKTSGIPVKSLNLTKFTPWRILKLIKLINSEIKADNSLQPPDTAKAVNSNNSDNISNTLNTHHSTSNTHHSTSNIQHPTPYIQNPKSEIQNPTTNSLNPSIHTSTHNHIILHSHLIHANLTSRIVSLFINRNRVKVINTIHIAEKRTSKWWHFFFDRLTFRLCDVQTAVSEAAQIFHSEKIGIDREKIPVIYNGINPAAKFTEEEVLKARKQWGFEKCSKVIGSVGRLNWQKGYDNLLKLIPELSKKIPKGQTWGIVIIGEGPQRGELEKIINKIDFKNIKINLPGYRKDAADCISAFDLFVMPSRYEGHPLTLIEAMSQGIPIVANDIPTITNVIKDYSNGQVCSFETISKPVDYIKDYITKDYIEPFIPYSINNMADEYSALFKLPK